MHPQGVVYIALDGHVLQLSYFTVIMFYNPGEIPTPISVSSRIINDHPLGIFQ